MRTHRGTCRACHRPVVFAPERDDHDSIVVLEVHETTVGEKRWAIWDDGFARRLSPRTSVKGHAEHGCSSPASMAR